MWIKTPTSQAKKPLIMTRPLGNTGKILADIGKVALVEVTKSTKQ
jgi:hypothetical protein